MQIAAVCLGLSALTVFGASDTGAHKFEQPLEHFWVVNGPVSTFAILERTLYLGGWFSYAGPYRGSVATVGKQNGGDPQPLPQPNGPVHAVISDGSGGWIMAGSFTRVGDHARTNLVRIRADRTVDPVIYPAPAGSVNALLLHGGKLLVGGSFVLHDDDFSTSNLAVMDPDTGSATKWDAAHGPITSMVSYGDFVYATGGWKIGVVDVAQRTLRQLPMQFRRTNPASGGDIGALAVAGDTLYVGGRFDHIDSNPHGSVAAVDLVTETVKDWDPLPSDRFEYVGAIAANSDSVFLAGTQWVNAYDPQSAERRLWDLQVSGGSVNTLIVDGLTVFMGGAFTNINNQARLGLGAVDAATGKLRDWTVHANAPATTMLVGSDSITIGGSFTSLGGVLRTNLAAIDMRTGAATDWAPSVNGAVAAMLALTNGVFIGGNFTSVNGNEKNFLAALDRSSGATLPLDAGMGLRPTVPVSPVSALARAGDYIYAGGLFTNSFGTSQGHLTAFHAQTFAFKDNFRPVFSTNRVLGYVTVPGVTSLEVHNNTLYVAGMFVSINGMSRTNAAAFNLDSGELAAWAPQPSGFASAESLIRSMSVLGDRMFICGNFSFLAGQRRRYNAVVDLEQGRMLDWPEIPVMQWGIYSTPEFVFLNKYLGGFANTIGVHHPLDGHELDWRFDLNGRIHKIELSDRFLIVAGRFDGAGSGSISSRGIAVFPVYLEWGYPSRARKFSAPIGGRISEPFIIEASTNLLDWTRIASTNATLRTFVDEEFGNHPQRFFRIRNLSR